MQKVVRNTAELTIVPQTMPHMPIARQVLMVRPTFFNIDTPINAHMLDVEGKPHHLNKTLALQQWENLRETYGRLGFRVVVHDGVDGLPDMCFCANQSLPYVDDIGRKCSILSNMATSTRHKEVPYVCAVLEREGYTTHSIGERTPQSHFEGMGDCLWLPGHRFLLGGYGHRTHAAMYERVSERTNAPVAIFELKNSKFYHLDTCLSILNSTTALACREAFTDVGWTLLGSIFKNILEVPITEADSPHFACNAHCPDQKHVIIQSGSPRTESLVRGAGFTVVPVDTSEFIKSGGSVFCLKLMFF